MTSFLWNIPIGFGYRLAWQYKHCYPYSPGIGWFRLRLFTRLYIYLPNRVAPVATTTSTYSERDISLESMTEAMNKIKAEMNPVAGYIMHPDTIARLKNNGSIPKTGCAMLYGLFVIENKFMKPGLVIPVGHDGKPIFDTSTPATGEEGAK